MTKTPSPEAPPLDLAQLAELAHFFRDFGDWFRAQLQESDDAARAGRRDGVAEHPEGVRAVTFFADELAANTEDFSLAAARLMAMAESRPVQVRRLKLALPAPLASSNHGAQETAGHLRVVK